MTALAERTVEVTPLGLRGRYSLTTRKQARLYQAIVAHFDRRGAMPNFDEMVDATGNTRAHLRYQLNVLEECRWVDLSRDHRGHMEPRGIRLIEPVLRDLKPCR